MNKLSPSLSGKELVDAILGALNGALAEEITVLDLRELHGAGDWFIVCQGDNTVHTRACADRILDHLIGLHTRPWQKEGLEDGRWILLDFSDVIVHIMLPELREYYRLEDLWRTGK
ncbi:MAG: ribosome silencing factor [Chitinispirillaceae bacterium]|nr:ribosome silencing factor [Chitinispirillaceae bacterium]